MPGSSPSSPPDTLRRFVGRLLLFPLPLAVIWLGLEAIMAAVPNPHSAKRDQLRALSGEIDTLIVGASGAFMNIRPEHLAGSAYNLGNLSESLYYTDQLVSRWTPRLPKLRRVVVTVGYASLYFQLRKGEREGSTQYFWQREWDIPPQRPSDRYDLRMWSRVALCDWHVLARSARRLWEARGDDAPLRGTPEVDPRGWWTRQVGVVDPSARAAAVTLARHHAGMRDENLAANLDALEHLLAQLHARQIEVILLVPPVWSTYAAGVERDRWEFATATYQRLARVHGARYLDYFQSSGLPREDFYDPDHLNPAGAAHFSVLLNAALASQPSASSPLRP